MNKPPMAFAFGGGNDGTAALIEFYRRGIRPDLILFSDTGNRDSEKPGTYAHVDRMNEWCKQRFGVPITTVRNDGQYKTLENECLSKHMLPSIAYGFKSCSDKYKIRPQEKFCQDWALAIEAWAGSGLVVKGVGYNASEPHRAAKQYNPKYENWYPLIEWGITRPMVLDIVTEEFGAPVPKSACFFCPASKKSEVIRLSREYPDLFARAVQMERNAASTLQTVKGLGRHYSWEELVKAEEAQFQLFPETVQIPCVCFDGQGDDDEEDEEVLILRENNHE